MPFPQLDNHIIFVSNQNVPVLLGACIYSDKTPCVHALVSDKMKKESQILGQELKSKGCKYFVYPMEGADHNQIWKALNNILQHCNGTVGLNLTSGTKLMALTGAAWADDHKLPTFYIDTENRKIVMLGGTWKYVYLPDILDVASLLGVYGYTVESFKHEPIPLERTTVFQPMLDIVCGSLGGTKALLALNAHASNAAKNKNLVTKKIQNQSVEWQRLLNVCKQAGMLDFDDVHIAFTSHETLSWCNGIWLEEYVRMILCKLATNKKIKSWVSSAKVKIKDVRNELDLLFSAHNRLFTIECKTIKMGGATTAIYKADSLNDRLGGIFTRSMLCTVNPLFRVADERAANLGIRVVSGKKLKNLYEIILQWSQEK